MPYRRLPNTDKARIRVMKKALNKSNGLHPNLLAFSQKNLVLLRTILPRYEQAIIHQRQAYQIQIKENKKYIEHQKSAQLYLSHFVQVLNFTIIRNELSEKVLSLYALDEIGKKLPNLNTEKLLLEWGEKIIFGETTRIHQGGVPISNPKISMVNVKFSTFKDSFFYQKKLQETTLRTQKKVSSMRQDCDKLIQTIWNEVEIFHESASGDKRKLSEEYGVTYVYRKHEKIRRSHSMAISAGLIGTATARIIT